MTRWARSFAVVALGAATAVLELLFLLLGGALFSRYAHKLADHERTRLGLEAGTTSPGRTVAYLAARIPLGLAGALAIALLFVGAGLAGLVVRAVATGTMTVPQALVQAILGGILLLMNLQVFPGLVDLERRLARRLLAASSRAELEQRIRELATSRAEVIAAVDAERQRIERDLHDGLQQRLVALGMLLGRARRSSDPAKAADLITQAHADVQTAVEEMREVAWRVYPSALAHSSLDEVLATVARQAPVPVRIAYRLPDRPDRGIETALYFVACEAITNAAKHARATVITITVEPGGTGVRMLISDDGVGGADPLGSGLRGLARRVAALDGRFEVDSPPGSGTTIRVEVPCA